ncbi:MAG: hypothetical protein M3Y60_03620, partial [Bacteroidota bacterium]|nr:hypothetical protein [Bacteroidota bacterium]
MLTSLTGYIPFLWIWLAVHPIHVSVTEIEFDPKDRSLEIMMRVFIDDFELSLRNSLNQPELDILNPPKGVTVDDLASNYLSKHFRIALDNKPQKTVYLGHEREAEAFIFYIEVKNVEKWNTIKVHNDIIMGTYDDQSNLVHVFVNDNVRSLRLTRNTPADELTFK